MTDTGEKGAILSCDGVYRYALMREWEPPALPGPPPLPTGDVPSGPLGRMTRGRRLENR